MQKYNKITKAIRVAVMFGAAAAISAPAFSAEESEDKAEKIERIEVTGSRIFREGAIAPSPVTVVTGADLLKTGAVSIGESLRRLPALSNSSSFASSDNYTNGTTGTSRLNLRNMGENRTLVLVDGKRHVAASQGSATVDINTIPSAWVDRVEIITGGASAIYGADAVTGVVNFILKKNITGLDFSAKQSASELSDAKTSRFSLSYGMDFDDGRGNIAVAAEYASQNQVKNGDHPWSSESVGNWHDFTNNPDTPDNVLTRGVGWYPAQVGGYASLGQQGVFTFREDGSPRLLDLGVNPDTIWRNCIDCDGMYFAKYLDLRSEFDNSNFSFKSNYDITDDINVYFDAKYSTTHSIKEIDASWGGFWHDVDHPYMHPEMAAMIVDNGWTGTWMNRQNDDLGLRTEINDRDTTRFVVGVEGYVNDDWAYDVSLVRGETTVDRTTPQNRINDNLAFAVDAIELDGEIVCASAEARADGCIAFNYMGGPNQATQAHLDYLTTTSYFTTVLTQTVFSASVNNSQLFELPAGDIGFAAGMEYRKEESKDSEPKGYEGTFSVAPSLAIGEFDVSEVFAEVIVPLVSDVYLVQDLSAEAAVRYADYSTIGGATSWKLGLNWAVNDELRFRTTLSEAVRAPNIGELFNAVYKNPTWIADPCTTDNLATIDNPETRIANCAALGIPADFNPSYDTDAQLWLDQGGNPDLKQETSTSTTVGFVYQPEFLENFVVTVDYWNIEIDDAVGSFGHQTIVDNCVDATAGINNPFCDIVTRDASTHYITNALSSVINTASLTAEGIDFELNYNFDVMGATFNTNLMAEHKLDRTAFTNQADPTSLTELTGTTTHPDWSGVFNFAMVKEQLTASWSTRYKSAVDIYTAQSLAVNPNPSNIMDFGSYVISNASVGYNFENGLSVAVGVDNIFNTRIPFGAASGSGYDNMGRVGYLTLEFSM